MTKWIEDWFGSDYYSLLYRHRDEEEAKQFIDNLIGFLNIPSGSNILDCGCGRGRHSVHLSKRDFEGTGLDISKKSISCAKKQEKKNLTFHEHDLRNIFKTNHYDAALSLFTSFGYFENESDNDKVIKTISSSLKKHGWFVLDFMNAEKEIKELVANQQCKADNVLYDVQRSLQNNCIVKEITVTDKGEKQFFREQVKAYKQSDLENFFGKNHLEIVHLLGDYSLSSFDKIKSERLILIGRNKFVTT